MSTSTRTVSGSWAVLQRLYGRVTDSNEFVGIMVIGLFGGGVLTLLAGLSGLVGLAFVVLARLFNGPVELDKMGWLFVATAVVIFIFDIPFALIALDPWGNRDEDQKALNLTFLLSLICLIVTAVGAYLILTQNTLALFAALDVPIFNLIFFLWATKRCGFWDSFKR